MKIPMYFNNQFISYCNFPNKDCQFDFEITLEEIIDRKEYIESHNGIHPPL